MYDEFFQKALQLQNAGCPFATATVIRAEKPTSSKPGDRAIVTLDGVMFGWIGGSCAQPTVVREARRAIVEDKVRVVRLTPDPAREVPREGVLDVAMTCFSGGTLEVYIEPQQPQPRLIVVGTLPVAQALAHLGQAMNYRVLAIAPDDSAAMTHADEVQPGVSAIAPWVTPLTFVVVATHGNGDEEALAAALRTRAPYVGLVASRTRGEAVQQTLRDMGLTDEQLARLRIPAGLDIKARRGDEIALSVMAEIVQARRTLETLMWGDEEPSSTRSPSIDAGAPVAVAAAPVCSREVEIATAKHAFEHQGTTYYFCCPGCRARFAKAPGSYLVTAGEG